jgi:hypothetical protein
MKKARFYGLLGLVLLVGGCSTGEDASRKPQAETAARASGPLQQLGGKADGLSAEERQSMQERYPVLRTSEEALEPKFRSRVARILHVPTDEIASGSAQRLDSGAGPLWLLETDAAFCLVHQGTAALSCTPPDEFLAHGLTIGLVRSRASAANRFMTIGLVPGWVARVLVRVGPARRAGISVADDGLFQATGNFPVLVVRYCRSTAGGCHPVPILHRPGPGKEKGGP